MRGRGREASPFPQGFIENEGGSERGKKEIGKEGEGERKVSTGKEEKRKEVPILLLQSRSLPFPDTFQTVKTDWHTV